MHGFDAMHPSWDPWLVEQGLTSHSTQFRSFRTPGLKLVMFLVISSEVCPQNRWIFAYRYTPVVSESCWKKIAIIPPQTYPIPSWPLHIQWLFQTFQQIKKRQRECSPNCNAKHASKPSRNDLPAHLCHFVAFPAPAEYLDKWSPSLCTYI